MIDRKNEWINVMESQQTEFRMNNVMKLCNLKSKLCN